MTSTASVPTHAVAVPTFGKFFLPGPTDVHPDVLEAMIRPMMGHRSSGMEKLLQGIAPQLGALARTARPLGGVDHAVNGGWDSEWESRLSARRIQRRTVGVDRKDAAARYP